ncbi:MAG: imelysin family protein [Nannocystaceae bacterium]
MLLSENSKGPRLVTLAALLSAALPGLACTPEATSPWEDEAFRAAATEVVDNYGALVSENYAAMVTSAEALDAAIAALLADPSEARLQEARAAWLVARGPYGETEVFRFYGGPIDGEDGVEGQVNAWPLDEVYIDYVEGAPMGGIINDPETYPTIDTAALIAANEALGEDTISTGWHAIEFLLWGQDLDPAGPGDRPYTDYVAGDEGTAANAERRRTYLELVSALLVEDLSSVAAAWTAGGDNYRAEFVAADPKESVRKMLLGMGSLSGAELAGERMTVAYETREQEDEHSCFSDNTHADLLANALGIENVYLGRYGAVNGAGITTLVGRLDADLDQRMRDELRASVVAIEAIPAPFDAAIQAPDGSPEREAVGAAIAALQAQTKTIAEVAALLEIELNLEE